MLHAIARNWWMLFLRGLSAVIFGILAFAWPGITLASLILIFGVYAIIDGEWPANAARLAKWLAPANFAADGRQIRPLLR